MWVWVIKITEGGLEGENTNVYQNSLKKKGKNNHSHWYHSYIAHDVKKLVEQWTVDERSARERLVPFILRARVISGFKRDFLT